ncbi:hypothetical protein FJT64_025793 [Amphibalanus amphitrite]|uniref:DUF6729 domain-containing protein n=1 Tax=Amphibalanus amphitrite TaxID=1232801 RepID=A0A6A4WJK5_AMPAM|nr:hypothetical protein FJT64_025793 [Amphibalanus amphitrite]
MPGRIWRIDLKCPRCTPARSLRSRGVCRRIPRVVDVRDLYCLAAEYHYCPEFSGTYISTDPRLVDQLARPVTGGVEPSVRLGLLFGRTLGSTPPRPAERSPGCARMNTASVPPDAGVPG